MFRQGSRIRAHDSARSGFWGQNQVSDFHRKISLVENYFAFRRRGRVAEGAPLLREYTLPAYRGFESLRLRHYFARASFALLNGSARAAWPAGARSCAWLQVRTLSSKVRHTLGVFALSHVGLDVVARHSDGIDAVVTISMAKGVMFACAILVISGPSSRNIGEPLWTITDACHLRLRALHDRTWAVHSPMTLKHPTG